MNFQTKLRIKVLIIVLVATTFACTLFEEESKKVTKEEYYAIEPKTTLEALTRGKNDVFLPLTNEIDYLKPPSGSTVNWKQSDYSHIADVFFRDILNDTLDGWKLNSVSYSLSCGDVGYGFQDARYQFFKIVKEENKREMRIKRLLEIDPRYKVVSLWEAEYYPKIMNRSSIDLNTIKFDSEQALQVAEDSGGRNQRLALDNACSITLSLSPDSAEYHGWNINYIRDDTNSSVFEVNIDPFTGDIQ